MARPSSRQRIIDAALHAFASAGEDVTIDAVARVAGITKQGVLYHFPDKRDLRAAMLLTVVARWEQHMSEELGGSLHDATVGERIRAYARVAARGDIVPGEAALFAQIGSRPDESAPFAEWVERYFEPPAGIGPEAIAQLNTAWLAANSLWSVRVNSKRHFSASDAAGVLDTIDSLTAGL